MNKKKDSTLKVLEIIKAELSATGEMPTRDDIRKAMGWKNDSAVGDVLTRLCRHGHMRRVNNYGPIMKRYELVECPPTSKAMSSMTAS